MNAIAHRPDLRVPAACAATLAAAALLVLLLGHAGTVVLWGLVCVAGAAVVWTRPDLGVLVMIGVLSVSVVSETRSARLLELPYLVGGALLVPLVLRTLERRSVVVFESTQGRWLLAIGALAAFATAWNEVRGLDVLSPGVDKTEWLLGAFVSRFGFLVLFAAFVDTWRRAAAVVVVVVGSTVLGALDAWRGFGGLGASVARAAGEFGYGTNSNRLAFVCVFAASFVWFFRASGPSMRWRPLLLPLLVILPATTLATGSRSGLLQMLAVGMFALRGNGRASARQKVGAALLLGVLGLGLVATLPADTLERATTFDASVRNPGQKSLQSRLYQMENALALAAEHPLLGVGIGNFEAVTTPIHEMGRGVHNSYLRALVEGGIGLLALYLALFASVARALSRALRLAAPERRWIVQGTRGALLAFLVYSFTADTWHADHLYLLVGLSIVTERLARADAVRMQEATT